MISTYYGTQMINILTRHSNKVSFYKNINSGQRITYALTVLGHLDSDARGSGSLANTTLSSDEDPTKGFLFNKVRESRRELVLCSLNHESILFFFSFINSKAAELFHSARGFGVLGFWGFGGCSVAVLNPVHTKP